MASDRKLAGDIKVTGMDQKSMYNWMANVTDLLNEVQTDHATLLTDIAAIRTGLVGVTAKLDADAGVTDTNYAATHDPAAISTASLSNSTAITLNKG